MKTIKVTDFTEFPGLRHCKISDDSGELFYHKILNEEFKKAIERRQKLQVVLDGTAGYAPSFLDEAFGNLIYDFGLTLVKKNIEIISIQEPDLIQMIESETFVQWEERRLKNKPPQKTIKHNSWWYVDAGGEIKNRNQANYE